MKMDAEAFENLLYCCTMHDAADEEIGSLTPELKCLKDADGLDRVRINDLDPKFLRTEFARSLVDPAWTLFRATQTADDPWDDIRNSAEKEGWLR